MTDAESEPANGYTCLHIEIEDAIGHLRLTRPGLLNRFDEPLHREFPRALAELNALCGQSISAVLISAAGDAFSAGGDLTMMAQANKSKAIRDRLAEEARDIISNLLDMPVPVIAAVQGPAIGLGATVIGCCDLVVAWQDAKIADPHVVLGLVAGDGGVLAWSQAMGIARAKRYLLTGEALSAKQAHAFGLVSDLVVNPEDALPVARKLAEKIASLPKGGVRGTKRAFAALWRTHYFTVFENSLADEMETLGGEEFAQIIGDAMNRDKGAKQ